MKQPTKSRLYYNITSLTLYFNDPPRCLNCTSLGKLCIVHGTQKLHTFWYQFVCGKMCMHGFCAYTAFVHSAPNTRTTLKKHKHNHTHQCFPDCKAIGGGSAYMLDGGIGIQNFHELLSFASQLHQISNFHVIVSTDDVVFMETHAMHREGRGCVWAMCEWQRHGGRAGKRNAAKWICCILK